jgi:hypothetical protein
MARRSLSNAVMGSAVAVLAASCGIGPEPDGQPGDAVVEGALHHGGGRARGQGHRHGRVHAHHHHHHHGGGGDSGGGGGGGGCPEAPVVTASLAGVFSVAEDDVWVVGGGGTILHYDGCWTVEASPTTADLLGVWATSGGEVWAVGDPAGILHRAAGAWTVMPLPVTGPSTAVWGAAPDQVWALAGTNDIVHWDGAAWAVVSHSENDLTALSGRAADDVYAVGSGKEPDGDYASIIRHWDGANWTEGFTCNPEGSRFASGGFVTFLRDVWAAPGMSVWAAGSCFAGFIDTGYVSRGSGTTFEVSTFPRDPTFFDESMGARRPLDAIFAAADDDVWAGSGVGELWDTTYPTALHFDGTTWTASQDLNTMGIRDMAGTASDDIWAVGAAGKRLHFDGTAWTLSP